MTPKLYRASEVCEATGLQPYVLRSWEKEFPGIGVQKPGDVARLYRPGDVEQVLRIKQLVFVEGLTLAGARRRLDEERPRTPATGEAEVLELLGADARSRIEHVRSGLRAILDVLSRRAGVGGPIKPANGASSTTGRKAAPAPARRKAGSAARPEPKRGAGASRTAASAKRAKRVAPARRPSAPKAATGKRKRASQ